MAKPTAVTEQNFQSEVLSSDVPVLVDFWAEWCGPCRMIGPVLDSISDEHGDKLKIVKLNVDENPSTAQQYGVMSIPTMILFKGGQQADRLVGAMPKQALMSKLGKHVNFSA
jgi:thioredoxin 1